MEISCPYSHRASPRRERPSPAFIYGGGESAADCGHSGGPAGCLVGATSHAAGPEWRLEFESVGRSFTQATLLGHRKAALAMAIEATNQGAELVDIYVDILQPTLFEIGRRYEAIRLRWGKSTWRPPHPLESTKQTFVGGHIDKAVNQRQPGDYAERQSCPTPTPEKRCRSSPNRAQITATAMARISGVRQESAWPTRTLE